MDKFYSCLDNVLAKYDRLGRKSFFQGENREDFEKWRMDSRSRLWLMLGMDKMENCPLSPEKIESVNVGNGIIREKYIIQTEPGVYMPFYALLPAKRSEHTRCFICPPGHSGGGKLSVAGAVEYPHIEKAVKRFNYDYGMQLARLGHIALCPDCRGFGERREKGCRGDDENQFLKGSCYNLAHMAEPLGITVLAMYTWDLMRLADYIFEYRKDWKPETLSCAGFSGGGMQALWFAALDDRVKLSFISGHMYGYRDSLLKLHGNCSCNYAPGLWLHYDEGDIASLIAPRPLVIQSCADDHLNGERGIVNAVEQVDIIRSAYKLFGSEHRVHHDICQGGHHWDSENLKTSVERVLAGQ